MPAFAQLAGAEKRHALRRYWYAAGTVNAATAIRLVNRAGCHRAIIPDSAISLCVYMNVSLNQIVHSTVAPV